MSSRNFDFLKPESPLLAQLGSTAEAFAAVDPAAALVKLRHFGEVLSKLIVLRVRLDVDAQTTQFDRLEALGATGHLPRSILDGLHLLRKAGNAAAHKSIGSSKQASALVQTAFHIACWYRATHNVSLPEPADSYEVVVVGPDPVERLREEMQELRRLVAASVPAPAEVPAIDLTAELERLLAPQRERYEKELLTLRREIERIQVVAASNSPRKESGRPSSRTEPDDAPQPTPQPAANAEHAVTKSVAPVCPSAGCGASMERVAASRAVARFEIAAGDPIWRCTRYPACKGWTPVDRGTKAERAEARARSAVVARPKHRTWAEYGERPDWDVTYLNCGGRLRCLSLFDELTEPESHALSQAAVFVSKDMGAIPSDDAVSVAAILRRILSRGVLPPVDPLIEQVLLDSVELASFAKPARHPGDLALILDHGAPTPKRAAVKSAITYREEFVPYLVGKQPNGTDLLHYDAELPFFRDWIPSHGETGLGQWWHPQASVDRLLSSAESGARRLDFLFASPFASVGVEIDGQQHGAARAVDADRDNALSRAGIKVVRVAVDELRRDEGTALRELAGILSGTQAELIDDRTLLLVWGPAVAHRVALGLSEALERGWLQGDSWSIRLDEPLGIAWPAVRAAVETIAAIAGIWNVSVAPLAVHVHARESTFSLVRAEDGAYEKSDIGIADAENADSVRITVQPFHGPYHELPSVNGRHVLIRSTFLPIHFMDNRRPGGFRSFTSPTDSVPGWALRRMLNGIFAKREFQPEGPEPRGQEVAIRRILSGQDTVVLLPTGAGKSLIYQLAGLLTPGLTLIIDPIVALIEDQLDGLRRQGIDRTIGISSVDTREGTAVEKLAQLQAGDALFAFIAPERLQQQKFRTALRTMSVATPINLIVVDEAHCVSEWGHDFRTSYLDIGRVLRHVAADASGAPPPLLALTGTASRAVLKDMLIELSVDRADPEVVISPADFDRPELRFGVVRAEHGELVNRVVGAIHALPSRFRLGGRPKSARELLRPRGDDSTCGIVFCQTIQGDRGIVRVSEAISAAFQVEAPIYAGSAPKGVTDFDKTKRRNASRFKDNEATLLVATKSYGMGIDKPNVRYIIHAGIPASIEGYYQEAGRAGRDRRESICLIVHGPEGRDTLDFFHGKTFSGIDAELGSLQRILDLLLPADKVRIVSLPFGRDDENRERAIHRLKLLDLVEDYTVDFGRKKFAVRVKPVSLGQVDAALLRFVRRNQPGRVPDFERRAAQDAPGDLYLRIVSRAAMMIDYVYETIVASRKRAADEMEALAAEGADDEVIRDRILKYLALGRVASSIEEIIDVEPFHFAAWTALLDSVEGSEDAREWRGTTARFLASDPDNPGLLLGRGMAEAAVPSGDASLFSSSLVDALRSAYGRYTVTPREVDQVVEWITGWLALRRPEWRALMYGVLERALPDVSVKRLAAMEDAAMHDPAPEAHELAVVLHRKLHRITDRVRRINFALKENE